MFPFIHILGIFIPSYSIFVYMGTALGVLVMVLRAHKYHIQREEAFYFSLIAIVGAFIGAKVLFLIVEIPTFVKHPELLKYAVSGGFVYYGGFIGGIIAVIIYCRSYRLPIWTFADLAAPSIAIGHSLGRVGCFSAGCCYGAPTDLPWGVVFKESIVAPSGVPLHPVQLYEAGGNILLFAILLLFARKKRQTGNVFGLYLVLYSIERFTLEFLRDDPRGALLFFSTSQWISLLAFAWGVLILSGYLRNKKIPRDS